MTDIKSMKLYTHVGRIENELAELGKGIDDTLSVDDLSAFDQLHYHGTEALDIALRMIGSAANHRWLEIGSGIGGPARYLAQQGDLQLDALELQVDQNDLALQLTQRCGLLSRITHICGDFLDYDFAEQQYDAVVSWLALYHIPQRPQLLARCHALLKPDGRFYTEDLCRHGEIEASQLSELERDLYAITLPEIDAYPLELEEAGFEIEHCEEMTTDWGQFTRDRLQSYRADRARHIRVHGEATVDALEHFYSAVDHHFQSGKLGGVRICARKLG